MEITNPPMQHKLTHSLAMELNGMTRTEMDTETINTAHKVTISLTIQTDGKIVMKME